MKRRDFGRVLAVGSISAITANCEKGPIPQKTEVQPKKKALMHVGCQSGGTSKENLEFKARHGVYHIDGGSPRTIDGVGWDLEDSLAKKEACEKYGISLEAYHLPLYSAGS